MTGVLVSPTAFTSGNGLEAGAPGLPGAGKSQSVWLATAIAAALALALSGSLLERRRPQERA